MLWRIHILWPPPKIALRYFLEMVAHQIINKHWGDNTLFFLFSTFFQFYVGGCPHCIDAAAADDDDDDGDDNDDDVVDDGDDDDNTEVKCLEGWDEVTNSIIGESTNTPSYIMTIIIIIIMIKTKIVGKKFTDILYYKAFETIHNMMTITNTQRVTPIPVTKIIINMHVY